MMKRLCTALVLSLTLTAAISAQDRIAVLDTELPKGMDTKVVIPVTEKIMEEFVRSKLFTVLDRSFIAKTLSELEFSTSDLTAGDTDKLATIGGFLKATYIVVSTVQLLDRTYFLSAKLIEVKTGVITAQSSVNRDGSISVLIDMAGELGQKLVAAAMGQDVKSSGRTATQSTAPAPTKEPIAAKPAREPKARSPRFSTVSVDFGTGATIATEVETEYNYFTWINGDFEAVTGSSYGLSCVLPIGLFYISANGSLTTAEYSGPSDYVTSEAFVTGMGFGIDLMLGPVLTYAGARVGYMSVSITDDYTSGVTDYNTWSGISYGFELGGDIRLGSLALGVRYLTDLGTLVDENDYFSDMDAAIGSLSLRLGWAF